LYYGGERHVKPVYDTASIQELLGKGYPINSTSLGPETAVAQTGDKLEVGKFLHSNLLLEVMIGLMVAVLVWSLYRVGKRISHIPD